MTKIRGEKTPTFPLRWKGRCCSWLHCKWEKICWWWWWPRPSDLIWIPDGWLLRDRSTSIWRANRRYSTIHLILTYLRHLEQTQQIGKLDGHRTRLAANDSDDIVERAVAIRRNGAVQTDELTFRLEEVVPRDEPLNRYWATYFDWSVGIWCFFVLSAGIFFSFVSFFFNIYVPFMKSSDCSRAYALLSHESSAITPSRTPGRMLWSSLIFLTV